MCSLLLRYLSLCSRNSTEIIFQLNENMLTSDVFNNRWVDVNMKDNVLDLLHFYQPLESLIYPEKKCLSDFFFSCVTVMSSSCKTELFWKQKSRIHKAFWSWARSYHFYLSYLYVKLIYESMLRYQPTIIKMATPRFGVQTLKEGIFLNAYQYLLELKLSDPALHKWPKVAYVYFKM